MREVLARSVLCAALAACGGGGRGPAAENLPIDDAGMSADANTAPEASTPADCHDPSTNHDVDHDGFGSLHGDCDDCDPLVNPGALDLPGDQIDQDCQGGDASASTDPPDHGVDPGSQDPEDAARALGMGSFPSNLSRAWGVLSARWRRLDGSHELHSALQVWGPERFGDHIAALEGRRLWVMSSGVARDRYQTDYTKGCDVFDAAISPQDASLTPSGDWPHGTKPPRGYPRDSSQCPMEHISEGALAYNDVGLELEIRVPTNVQSLSFDSMFFTYEYPDYVCSPFNDFFLVLVSPAPAEHADGNVVFDSNGDDVGVNTALLSVCRQSDIPPRTVSCQEGPRLLAGTGFDANESYCASSVEVSVDGGTSHPPQHPDIGGASTGWLRTQFPVRPGSLITLYFVLWDSGDPLLDSTVLLDNLQFHVEPVAAPQTGALTAGF